MIEDHAPLPPSSAEQWGHCSGWLQATAGEPDRPDPRAIAGTASHWVGAEVLVGHAAHSDDLIGVQAPNGVVIDAEMAEGAQVWVEDVREVANHHPNEELLVEHRVHMPDIHANNWGTTDTALYAGSAGKLYVCDYKFGHRDCPPVGNLQLINYARGLANKYEINGFLEQYTQVVFRIVQPFCYYARGPVREWVVPLSDLRPYWNQLHNKAAEAHVNPKFTTGSWCRDCKALHKCSAARKANYNFIELADAPYELDDMTPADLAAERQILERGLGVAKSRLEAIEDQLYHAIRNGAKDCPLTVEDKPGRETWNVPPSQAKALFAQFGVDISKEDVLTPKQALKKAPTEKRSMLEMILKRFIKTNSTSTLVPVDESRCARAFKKRS